MQKLNKNDGDKIMTIAQALKFAAAKLNSAKISLPDLEAEILLSGILKKPREFLLVHGEKRLSKKPAVKYQLLLNRRLKGEPIAYLIGHKEFYGLDFMVNKNVLIPRPETELMVEKALKLITPISQPTTLIDVGTGSGCIIVSLAKRLNQKSEIIGHKFIGTDISKSALNVARKNSKLHGLDKSIKFIHGNLLKPILNSSTSQADSKLVILANLPYGWLAWKNNCSLDAAGLKFEPSLALFTGENGLDLYKKLFRQIKNLTAKLSAACYVLCEFDPRQTAKIKRLAKQKLPEAKCQIKKDLSGLNRLLIITVNCTNNKF